MDLVNNDEAAQAPTRVVFVGAGPGDPELLTMAAVAALEGAATVLLQDESLRPLLEASRARLRPDAVVASLPDAGDASAGTLAARVEAVRGAAERGTVVRLVPGDPFLDGRVAGEAAGCLALGLEIDVVPGVAALLSVPEYAGIELGPQAHLVDLVLDRGPFGVPADGTVLLRCRCGDLAEVRERALDAGRPADQALTLTFRGGSTRQETRSGRLGELSRIARTLDPDEVVHLVLGTEVGPGPEQPLDWFEGKPLFGWRVLVPRTKDQAGEMVARLARYGAHAEEVPTIQVEPPRTPQQMDKAIRGLVEGSYEWVAFTSANAVKAVREKFEALGLDSRAFSGLRIAAVGAATARALREWGIVADLVPTTEHSAAGLAREFPAFDEVLDPINRVFLPRADIATEVLVEGLVGLGWEVDDVVAYRTVRAAPPPAEVREAIKTGKFDAALFTSSSTVRNLVGIAGKPHSHTVVAAIGPQTAATCVEHGLEVEVQPAQPGGVELVDALAAYARRRRSELVAEGRPVTRPSETRRRRRPTA